MSAHSIPGVIFIYCRKYPTAIQARDSIFFALLGYSHGILLIKGFLMATFLSVLVDRIALADIKDVPRILSNRYGVFSIMLSYSLMTPVFVAAEGRGLEDMILLALSVADARAVVRLPSGRLVTIVPGERLPQVRATVAAVLDDRLVLEVEPDADGAPGERAWLYKGESSEHESRIRILGRMPPPQPAILIPVSQSIEILAEDGVPAP